MKYSMITLFTGVMLLFFHVGVKAQFEVQAEYRPRTELRDGFKTLLTDSQHPSFITSQRTRLNISFADDAIETFLAIQDVRVWGDEVYKTDNAVLNVYQAYAAYFFNKNLSIKIGRQELAYDNKRLLGPRNWNNVGASHDIGLLRFKTNGYNIHLGGGYNNDKEKNYETGYLLNYYKYFSFLWMNKIWENGFSFSIMNIFDGYQSTHNTSQINTRGTSGFYTKWTSTNKNFGNDAALYYQFGKSVSDLNISAYYFSISQFYQPNSSLKFLLGLDYFSGDDALNDNQTVNTFDKLYGDGHGPYGYMDYFTEIPKHTKNGGLMDAYFRLNYAIKSKTNLELTGHNFRLTGFIADTISNPGLTQTANQQLGIEIDFMLKHKLHKNVEFRAGYSTMLASQSMEIIKGGDAGKYQQWGWMMFIINPTLFKQD